jgi:hypothetical protein
MEGGEHGSIKAETPDICAKRAEWNTAVVKKWKIQKSEHGCRQRRIANANPLPVEGQEYDW